MKITIKIFLMIFFTGCNLVNAQLPNWLWARSGAGSLYDTGQAICSDANNNVYVTGAFDSSITFGTTTLNSVGGADVYFAKYDPNGNLIWAKNFGGSLADLSYSINTDINGDIFILGSFYSPTIAFGTRILHNSGNADVFLTKFDTDGNFKWAKKAGGIYLDLGTAVSTDANGNVYITGSFESNAITFDSITLVNAGVADIFIVKYDSSGNLQWANNYGGILTDVAYGLSIDLSGNILITGNIYSDTVNFGATTLYNTNYNGGSDIFITKIDPSGNILWAKNANGNYQDYGYGITTDISGNVIITGEFGSGTLSFGTITIVNNGYYDFFIAKFDSSGNALWAQAAGGIGYEYGSSIDVDSYGNIYVGGTTQSTSLTFGTFTLTNPGNQPIFIVKYDALGNVIWAENENANYCNGLNVDANENIVVIGSFNYQNLILGSDTLLITGLEDVFFAKIEGTSTDIIEHTLNSGITIAPNPFTDETTITFKEEQKNTTIKIIDILGNEVSSITFSGKIYVVEKGSMPSGLYFIQALDEMKNSLIEKVIVQ